MVGDIDESMRLPGATAFGSPCTQAEHVRRAGDRREVVHLVVEHEAEARHGDAAAEPGVERRRQRDGVALGVDDREVRRVRTARHAGADVRERAPSSASRGPSGSSRAAAVAHASRQQLVDRVLHEVGIAELGVARGERAAHRLDRQVHLRRASASRGPQVPPLEQVRNHRQRHAARRRRRHPEDAPPAVREVDRRRATWRGSREVLARDEASAALHRLPRRARRPAPRRSPAGPPPRCAERRARGPGCATSSPPGEARRSAGRARADAGYFARRSFSVADRLRRTPSSTTKPFSASSMAGASSSRHVLFFEPSRCHASQSPATLPGTPTERQPSRESRVGLPSGPRYMSRVAARGRRLAEVERVRRAADARDHEAAAADVARGGERDRERERGRDRGVDRVAAAREHLDAHLRGDGVVGRRPSRARRAARARPARRASRAGTAARPPGGGGGGADRRGRATTTAVEPAAAARGEDEGERDGGRAEGAKGHAPRFLARATGGRTRGRGARRARGPTAPAPTRGAATVHPPDEPMGGPAVSQLPASPAS